MDWNNKMKSKLLLSLFIILSFFLLSNKIFAEEATPIEVYLIYPSDQQPIPDYEDKLNQFMQELSTWYQDKTGLRFTPLPIQILFLDMTYSELRCPPENKNCDPATSTHTDFGPYVKAVGEFEKDKVKLIFAPGAGGFAGGDGGRFGLGNGGIAMVGDWAIQGIAGASLWGTPCNSSTFCSESRAKGTTAHELGHAFGLPHPDSDPNGNCSVMLNSRFPDGIFLNSEIDFLKSSPFFEAVSSPIQGKFICRKGDLFLGSGNPNESTDYFLEFHEAQFFDDSPQTLKLQTNEDGAFGDHPGRLFARIVDYFNGNEFQSFEITNILSWSNKEITFQLSPDQIRNEKALKFSVVDENGNLILPADRLNIFMSSSVSKNSTVEPETVIKNSEITIQGDGFGDIANRVTVYNYSDQKYYDLEILSWLDNEIKAKFGHTTERVFDAQRTGSIDVWPKNSGRTRGKKSLKLVNKNSLSLNLDVFLYCKENDALIPFMEKSTVSLFNGSNSSPSYVTAIKNGNGNISYDLDNAVSGSNIILKFDTNYLPYPLTKTVTIGDSLEDINDIVDFTLPTCPVPSAIDGFLISNNFDFSEKLSEDPGSDNLIVKNIESRETIDWTLSPNSPDQTIYIREYLTDGITQEFQIPTDLTSSYEYQFKNLAMRINNPIIPETPPVFVESAATNFETEGPRECSPESWSNKQTSGEFRCSGIQACYDKWQEDPYNNCQPIQVGEDCEDNDYCAQLQGTTEPTPVSDGPIEPENEYPPTPVDGVE